MIILLFVLIIGLCIGSFLNVVILRAFSNESIVFPASKCPKCQHKLYWWHNIPVLSYILLRGKCGFCKEKISIQYPIIELVTGLIFVLVFLKYGFSVDTLFSWGFASLFIVLAVTDIKEKVVFDAHTYSLIAIGLLYAILVASVQVYADYSLIGEFEVTSKWLLNNHVTESVFGLVLGFVFMELIARSGYLLAGTRAFGEGDSYIAAGLGAVFGWRILVDIIVMSIIIQFILTIPMFIKTELTKKNYKTLGYFGLFIAYTIAFVLTQYFGYLTNMLVFIPVSVGLLIIGLLLCRAILSGIKNNPEERTYLPFGPALVIAGFIVLLI